MLMALGTAPLAIAQSAEGMRRVGILMNRPASDQNAQASFVAFKQGL